MKEEVPQLEYLKSLMRCSPDFIAEGVERRGQTLKVGKLT